MFIGVRANSEKCQKGLLNWASLPVQCLKMTTHTVAEVATLPSLWRWVGL